MKWVTLVVVNASNVAMTGVGGVVLRGWPKAVVLLKHSKKRNGSNVDGKEVGGEAR